VDRHQIPAEYPLDLIEGCRMDLNQVRYRNFAELRVFCYRVASTVGLMMCKVIGFRRPGLEESALPKAIDLGIAMQLTNILRDVGDDLRLGRIYLPQDEMEEFGYTADDLAARRINDPFRRLMAAQAKRARDYYASAEPGIAMLNPRGAYSVKIASDVYRQILAVIERNHYQVFERRAVVPSMQKYWLTLRSMALPVARHAAGSAFSRLSPWKS
jgi:phytoene synthase